MVEYLIPFLAKLIELRILASISVLLAIYDSPPDEVGAIDEHILLKLSLEVCQ